MLFCVSGYWSDQLTQLHATDPFLWLQKAIQCQPEASVCVCVFYKQHTHTHTIRRKKAQLPIRASKLKKRMLKLCGFTLWVTSEIWTLFTFPCWNKQKGCSSCFSRHVRSDAHGWDTLVVAMVSGSWGGWTPESVETVKTRNDNEDTEDEGAGGSSTDAGSPHMQNKASDPARRRMTVNVKLISG